VAPGDEPLTRGARKAGGAGATPTDPAVSDAVAALLPPAGVKPTPPQTAPRLSSTPTPSPKPANKPDGSSQQLVDDLLTQASKGARKASQPPLPKSTSPVATKDSAATRLTQGWMQQRSKALDSDPSYVFFRPAPDQSAQAGPVGALGVPLTAGRSLAVDPRVMPLGYPVFLDAAGGDRRQPQMQRLMFAQDTGGAIRGAVRADYFWGFGADAGRQARKTKHRGRMWVLVPHAEVEALMSSKLLTRGAGVEAAQRDCLIADEAYCDDDTTP
jgi:membrane-bound lytic murein transglycosylase A